jgi:hypothetical protein
MLLRYVDRVSGMSDGVLKSVPAGADWTASARDNLSQRSAQKTPIRHAGLRTRPQVPLITPGQPTSSGIGGFTKIDKPLGELAPGPWSRWKPAAKARRNRVRLHGDPGNTGRSGRGRDPTPRAAAYPE